MSARPNPTNEHAARMRPPSRQIYKTFRRVNDFFYNRARGDRTDLLGIDAIIGIRKTIGPHGGRGEIQSLRFRANLWSVGRAKRWLESHKMYPLMFEPATGKGEKMPKQNPSKRKKCARVTKKNPKSKTKKRTVSRSKLLPRWVAQVKAVSGATYSLYINSKSGKPRMSIFPIEGYYRWHSTAEAAKKALRSAIRSKYRLEPGDVALVRRVGAGRGTVMEVKTR